METKQQKIWSKAAVIGSIWASFEIVFGSFFHSLRLPFAGTFLTFFAVVLLVSFSYKWNDKNIFLKAGLIAALMRSLMPTSVILGPLIGILTEAVLFQISINLFKRNFFAFALAGVLAMFSAVIHKIVSIILIYGFDVVKILENLYFVLLKSTHINLPLNQLLILVILTYTSLGILSGFIGMKIGKSSLNKMSKTTDIQKKWEVKNTLFELHDFKYQSIYIFFHLSILILALFALEFYPIRFVFPFVLFYFILLFKRYGKSLRRLRKPLFWLQLVVVIILAVLLWNNKQEGLIVGFKMILRAILVVSVFTAISVELKNPLVKSLLYKRGYSQLYTTLGLATSAVPFILSNLAVDKKSFINPFGVLRKSIGLSDILFKEFQMHLKQKNRIYIISGDTRSGKTGFLKEVVKTIRKLKPEHRINGLIAHGIDRNRERYGFEIENIRTGKKEFLCSQKPIENALKIGRFYFSENGLKFGENALTYKLEDCQLLIIDEIGYLELKGKGWFNAIEKSMKHPQINMIWVVRKRILENVLQLWQSANIKIVNIEKDRPEKIAEDLLKN